MFSPLPCFATLSRSTTPRKPDSRANCPVISGRPIGLIESTSISPSSIRYRLPTLTWGRVHIRTLQVISPRRTPSRRRLANTMRRVYTWYALWRMEVDGPAQGIPRFGLADELGCRRRRMVRDKLPDFRVPPARSCWATSQIGAVAPEFRSVSERVIHSKSADESRLVVLNPGNERLPARPKPGNAWPITFTRQVDGAG